MLSHVIASRRSPLKILLAHRDAGFRRELLENLDGREVQVIQSATAEATHALAAEFRPSIIIVDADLPDQSGALTCAKLKISHPRCRVMLVGRQRNGADARLARFVGADVYVSQREGLDEILRYVSRRTLPARC
jgi:DNA-binding NarL/FixJ family response regulator